ncbi:FAD:protein FMN transferase [Deinococcus sp.]|uniref:FAD:protein FMN transferase n=1 Tax=Deinococcus sp. TaxID=47478 RepID=UPI003CC58C39
MKLLPTPLLRSLRRPRLVQRAAHFQGVLGTSLEVQVQATSNELARQAVQAALDEIARLERVFSRFDPGSELNRWLNDPLWTASEELCGLLRRAETWRALTGGAFHPGAEALTRLWREAEAQGQPPDGAAISAVLARLDLPVWSEEAGWRPALPLNLNAFAKGYIVDRAAHSARLAGASAVLVNIGGDLRHLPSDPHDVGVPVDLMNPFAPYANAAPLTRLHLHGGGLATSGGAFRGFTVGDARHSHLLDPRSGQPVKAVVSATVLAPTCADADALATALSVLEPADSLALTATLDGVECLLVTADGRCRSSPGVAYLVSPLTPD